MFTHGVVGQFWLKIHDLCASFHWRWEEKRPNVSLEANLQRRESLRLHVMKAIWILEKLGYGISFCRRIYWHWGIVLVYPQCAQIGNILKRRSTALETVMWIKTIRYWFWFWFQFWFSRNLVFLLVFIFWAVFSGFYFSSYHYFSDQLKNKSRKNRFGRKL